LFQVQVVLVDVEEIPFDSLDLEQVFFTVEVTVLVPV
jgi:hypothetical protein